MAVAPMFFFCRFGGDCCEDHPNAMILLGFTMLWEGLPAKKGCKQQGLYGKVDTTTVSNNSCMTLIDI